MTNYDSNGRERPLTIIDALYFTMVTISTVGYGDMSPINEPDLRIFSVCYILIGITIVFKNLAFIFSAPIRMVRVGMLALIESFDPTPRTVDTSGDGFSDTHLPKYSDGMSGEMIDLNGNGIADFVSYPSPFVYWGQELLPAFIVMVLIQLISAVIFCELLPDLKLGVALYHCFITATTVGYGDVSISTQSARLFSSFHILISVSWLGALLKNYEVLIDKREAQIAHTMLLTRMLNPDEVHAMDKDNKGVDKLEFVVNMLILLGVKLCDKPLEWNDVRPFILKFENLDKDNDGRIAHDELDLFVEQEKALYPKAAELCRELENEGKLTAGRRNWDLLRHTHHSLSWMKRSIHPSVRPASNATKNHILPV
uniref:Potassium channel domain-containing protein n=1 Tax=Octactis speculum TaxID=3111310 RepID=A0A6U3RFT8_9STRA